MTKQYDPSTFKTIIELSNLTSVQLADRYLKPNHKGQATFDIRFHEVVNIRNTENPDAFKYGAVACLEGANLQYIKSSIFKKVNSVAINNGYQLKLEQIIADLNKILNNNAAETIRSSAFKDSTTPYVETTVDYFINEILLNRTLACATELNQ